MAQDAADGKASPDQITGGYDWKLPGYCRSADPDLLIRTSENRDTNFPYVAAASTYTEFYFTDVMDFIKQN